MELQALSNSWKSAQARSKTIPPEGKDTPSIFLRYTRGKNIQGGTGISKRKDPSQRPRKVPNGNHHKLEHTTQTLFHGHARDQQGTLLPKVLALTQQLAKLYRRSMGKLVVGNRKYVEPSNTHGCKQTCLLSPGSLGNHTHEEICVVLTFLRLVQLFYHRKRVQREPIICPWKPSVKGIQTGGE